MIKFKKSHSNNDGISTQKVMSPRKNVQKHFHQPRRIRTAQFQKKFNNKCKNKKQKIFHDSIFLSVKYLTSLLLEFVEEW